MPKKFPAPPSSSAAPKKWASGDKDNNPSMGGGKNKPFLSGVKLPVKTSGKP